MRPPHDEWNEASDSSPMTEAEFANRFRGSYRAFWLIACGVLRDPALAEDVVQEAAMVALRKRAQFRNGTNFDAWVGQFVRHIAMNRARRERRSRSRSVDPATLEGQRRKDVADPVHTPAADPSSGEGDGNSSRAPLDDRVVDALREVGDVARTCLLLRTIEGLEYSRISALLDIPEGTAMSHVHRTRRFLRERLAGIADSLGFSAERDR